MIKAIKEFFYDILAADNLDEVRKLAAQERQERIDRGQPEPETHRRRSGSDPNAAMPAVYGSIAASSISGNCDGGGGGIC